tara:strand:+ start:56317 stop:56757 length:441 start_codon:yes stop_codon:yes gene_type:complete
MFYVSKNKLSLHQLYTQLSERGIYVDYSHLKISFKTKKKASTKRTPRRISDEKKEHINHTAIRILQIDNEQPRMCYNNYNRTPTGGTIIKFNDNVLNTNVTITPQDSTSINNTDLIQDLQPGLYNVIKNYNDGSQDENLIQKQNNE